MGMSASVEVVYRGVFQKALAARICRPIVFASRKEGKVGTTFSRYGDSPERNGIPAKNFAAVASDQEELEKSLARYEPSSVDVSVCLDDTLCKGIESWAWYGVQPINKLVQEHGVLLVASARAPEALLAHLHRKPYPWRLAIIDQPHSAGAYAPSGNVSLGGLWVYNDDNTDYRVLGAIARVAPEVVGIDALEQSVREQSRDEARVQALRWGYDHVQVVEVPAGVGSDRFSAEYEKPGWKDMREGIVVEARTVNQRNPYFKKWSTRTRRPVVNFEQCIKCTLCWLNCPDECFEVTPDGTYEVVYEACIGCSVCEDVCPVEGCITMVDELQFADNASMFQVYRTDPAGYKQRLDRLGISTGAPPAQAKGGAR